MERLIDQIRAHLPYDCLTDQEVANLLDKGGAAGTPHRRYGLVKRALKKGQLLRVRRGLYCLAAPYQRRPVSLFELAQRIYAPSYISFESALSFHGWIPEGVRSVTSATTRRAKDFDTPFGRFAYLHLPAKNFLIDVKRKEPQDQASFFVAQPWKAICDMVFAEKRSWTRWFQVRESLRIDEPYPPNPGELDRLEAYYETRRVSRLIQDIRKEFAP